MKQENKNFIYNVIYQFFILFVPLITTPYISRVLGVTNIGIYSYTYSIVYYFMLCGLIGINNYGSRAIAKKGRNIDKVSEDFINIYLLQFFLSIIMLVLYYFFTIFIYKYNTNIMLIQSISLISVIFDINWLYFGLEKFKITISRNIIIKLVSLFCIFLIVKENTDLWKYTLIMSSSMLISQLYLWIYLGKYVKFKKPSVKRIISNIKPCLILFIPVIAYSIYRVMDKTMIGFLSDTIQLGNYESAEKIINIPISIITALGTVMLPHMSKLNNREMQEKIINTFKLLFFIIVPICFGLFIISSEFSLLFFGHEFTLTGNIIKLLVITVIFTAIANVIRTSYLIPNEQDIIYVKSTILGAFFNLMLNLLFIKKYGAYGACIGTIMAEFAVMIYQIIKTKHKINYNLVFRVLFEYICKSMIMSIIILLIGNLIKNISIKITVQIFLAIVIYILLNYKYIKYELLELKNNAKL